jgi:glycosyltransferase involved in cell wall biosynthesis
LAVGTVEPRKNYKTLVESFNKIHQEDKSSKLIIVGKYGWKQSKVYEHLKSLKINAKVVYIEECCDSALRRLFENASAFISASLDEGFNIPAAEARSLGVPLILSDIAVHQEFHYDVAYFFDLLEIDEIWQIKFEDLSAPSVNVLDSFDKDVAKIRRIIGTLHAKG